MSTGRIIDRFDIYMKREHLNDNKVTIQLGLANGTIGKSRSNGRDLSSRVVEQILSHYKNLNRSWLISGDGPMIIGDGSVIQSIGDGSYNNTQVVGDCDVAVLQERIRGLEKILEEKERTIQILMGKNEKRI